MITGRWGKPSEVLLDLVVEADGSIRGVVNPGRQNAPIRRGHFDAASGALHIEGDQVTADGATLLFRFLERRIHSFLLIAELSNATLGFFDRMGGERLLDDRGQFGGSYGWRDVRTLIR